MSTKLLVRAIALSGAVAVAMVLSGCTPSASTPAASSSYAGYVTPGKLTIATGDPAYFPYVIDDKPESGQGFESAVAYAVAKQLGFSAKNVVWIRVGSDEAIQPGPKNFDFTLQQFSITAERKANVDFSSPYYFAPQAVVTIEGSAAEKATSLADLNGLHIGAASGSTSFTAAERVIKPYKGVQGFNTNEDSVQALLSNTVDAIVVDLQTAYYLTGTQLHNGVLIGQLPPSAGVSDTWGLVLAKDSPLTAKVSAAVDAIAKSGTLKKVTAKWLGGDAGAPILK